MLEHPLTEANLAGAMRLSASAHWNQCEADWRLMLALGRGWGLSSFDGQLRASTVALPYRNAVAGDFAWISMVLVLPEHRRKGLASRLLQTAIRELKAAGLLPILDATPAGREVYRLQGFRDTWGFVRYQGRAAGITALSETTSAPVVIRPLHADDWSALLALDAPAFGANRERLLRALAQRLPQAAWVAETRSRLAGFVFGRDGREAFQLGPLIANDPQTAMQLIAVALDKMDGPVYLDLADRHQAIRTWLTRSGFVEQRPFTRMVLSSGPAPGNAGAVVLVAGPELG